MINQSSPVIELKGVTRNYQLGGEIFTALSNINLTVDEGEFAALIGPSGSGKSTLMHIIGLLDQISSGEIKIVGQKVASLSDNSISAFRNAYIGFVFQQFNLLPKLTVMENILLPTIYARSRMSFNPELRVLEILEKFGIAEKKGSFPNQLSGGQQQRVAIARALMMEPKLILADEPTGNLDSKTGEGILKLLTQLNRDDGITILIVTHDLTIAKRTRRIIEIRDGKIV